MVVDEGLSHVVDDSFEVGVKRIKTKTNNKQTKKKKKET